MCNPKPSSPSSFVSNEKVHFVNSHKPIDVQVDDEELIQKWPTPSEVNIYKKIKIKNLFPYTPTELH